MASGQIRIVKSGIHLRDLLEIYESYPADERAQRSPLERYANELQETENRLFFLARTDDDSPVAYTQLLLKSADNDPELADGETVAHVHDLRVRHDLQGRGFGQDLMNAVEREARVRGISSLTLGVDNWNHRAMKFYEQLGYTRFKETPGRWLDEVCFFLRKTL